MPLHPLELGAIPRGGNDCAFLVWAPWSAKVEVHLIQPVDRLVPLRRDARGYHSGTIAGVPCGSDYRFRLDDQHERPDPASRWQPDGVHGSSRVVDPRFEWTDAAWTGVRLADYILYELHVGTFDPSGTFEGAVAHLSELKELGITAVELMPVAQFPGSRNWGYDGVFPFAVQNSYGGPSGLKRLVNAAHREGLGVVLDVVYNHLGPEGNYLGEFARYLTDRYRTPWGAALNYDGPESDEVRRYFVENALYWLTEYHIDALRLDAVDAIYDFSAVRQGRREEFAAFGWEGEVPDPQDEGTFRRCRLDHGLAGTGHHRILREFYGACLALRREAPAIGGVEKETMETFARETEGDLSTRQWHGRDAVLLVFNFNAERVAFDLPVPAGRWKKRLDSAEARWAGPGAIAPTEFASEGQVRLEAAAEACIVYRQHHED